MGSADYFLLPNIHSAISCRRTWGISNSPNIILHAARGPSYEVANGEESSNINFPHQFTLLFANGLGFPKGFSHKVTARHAAQPVQQKLRRLPLEVREKVSAERHKLEQADIIERIDASQWVSPIVVVWKKSGELRLCADHRKPNEAIVVDSHPLSHPDDLFHSLAGARHYSKLDLSSAHHQLVLAKESHNITAFTTHEGLFRYKKVIRGLASAAAAFQKMLSVVLKCCKGVLHYLNDILIFGRTKKDHVRHMVLVLRNLEETGLHLNKKKYVFTATEAISRTCPFQREDQAQPRHD
ncbi:uncharacterized protein K02A2.6-like [Ornithodoros turicata]|uniref:uncharacterized protein K02A2.6-like n=1 Tax=Ornithodoros turicata TaxID=34597 RepID=UPI003138CBB6